MCLMLFGGVGFFLGNRFCNCVSVSGWLDVSSVFLIIWLISG